LPWWGPLAIVVWTLAAYWPALSAGFIWDDDGHVTRPALRSLHGLAEIWFKLGATQQYYPLLHSFFWAEHALWGDAALGYHLANVLLHATAAVLLVQLLRRLAVPGAWAAGLIFALHPVGVESVAWISEEKNTLSAVFYLSAALAYLRFDDGAGCGESPRPLRWYFLATVLFAGALLSKSVTATLPAALGVILWWRKGKLTWRGDVLPLAPWLLLGLGCGLLTVWVERNLIGAQGTRFDLSAVQRCLLAGRVAMFYAGKLLWPAHLMFIYPRWTIDPRNWGQWASLVLLLALLAGALVLRRKSRGPLAALLLFVGSLFPALGFVNVYPFVFSFVADHFQYLAELSALPALVAAVTIGLRRWPPAGRALQWSLLAAVALALSVVTWREAATYRNAEVFYETLLARNPQCWLAEDNLGVILARQGQVPEAIAHYEQALRLNSDFPQTYNNYGNALARLHRWPQAFASYAQALRLWPGFTDADDNWGNALCETGQFPAAVGRYQDALRHRADDAAAEYGLGNALANSGQLEAAMEHYAAAARLRPDYAEAYANLGLALATAGRPADAIAPLTRALRIRPGYAEAHAYLGLALARSGRLAQAAAEYRAALSLNPRDRDVHYQLALVLRSLGQWSEAASEFQAAQHP